MIACCALLAISSLVRSQTDPNQTYQVPASSPGEYNFRVQRVADGASYGLSGGTSDPVPILTMNCLAANGAGQWTMTSTANGEFGTGWYLLENALRTPSVKYDGSNNNPTLLTSHPGCIPPGVVNHGSFGNPLPPPPTVVPTEPKVTTNLDNSVTYVWPDPNNYGSGARMNFVVEGFQTTDVDLSIASGFPNAAGSRNIVKPVTPTILTDPPTGGNAVVVQAGPNTDFRDEFDVCSDAAFIYITWCSVNGGGVRQIWEMTLDGTTRLAIGAPMLIGTGERPTIGCDPRTNRTGTPVQNFQIAYLTAHTVSSVIKVAVWNGTALVTTTLDNQYIDPDCATIIMYSYAMHARILVSSVAGQTPTAAVYAIVDQDGGTLIEYKAPIGGWPPGMSPTPATYVDGVLPTPPLPVPASSTTTAPFGWPIWDMPIVAMANPYDAQNTNAPTTPYNQFHCLYQYRMNVNPPYRFPLLIVRGSDNGQCSSESRLVLTQGNCGGGPYVLLNDPDNIYVAAVNQMGIHVHWHATDLCNGKQTHYYARDMNRTFDEDIDENTLVTDVCTVSDGTAHGGDAGAWLISPQMTVWTDPNYGFDPADVTGNSGLFQPRNTTLYNVPVGKIEFTGENTSLTLGYVPSPGCEAGCLPPPSTLAVYPYFFFHFSASGQSVLVQARTTFDYYGLIAEHDVSGHRLSVASPFIQSGFGDWGGVIDLEGAYPGGYWYGANLIVHGGADFTTGFATSLVSNLGNIDIQNESNLFPELSSGSNADATGHVTLRGETDIHYSDINTDITSGSEQVLLVENGYEYAPQFFCEHTTLYNDEPSACAEYTAEFDRKPFYGIDFQNCDFTASKIHVLNIENDQNSGAGSVLIDQCNFYEQHGRTIFIENTYAPTGLGEEYYNSSIQISNNYFYTINPVLEPDDDAHGTYGIYIKNIDGNFDGRWTDMVGNIVVEGNHFPNSNWDVIYPNWSSSFHPMNNFNSAAICFDNTTGNIISNTISDNGYNDGIFLKASIPPGYLDPPRTNTFVCSNTINKITFLHNSEFPASGWVWDMSGIHVQNHYGVIKLNTVSNCLYGFRSDGGHSNLSNNTITGIHTGSDDWVSNALETYPFSGENIVDLSGTHTASLDIPGNNTIYSDMQPVIAIVSGSLVNVGSKYNDGTWTQFGENNLYAVASGTGPRVIMGGYDGTADEDNIDRNYWGPNIQPANGSNYNSSTGCGVAPCYWNTADGSQVDATAIQYCASAAATRTSFIDPPSVECGALQARFKKGAVPLNVDSISPCQLIFNKGLSYERNGLWQKCYDTMKHYVELCAKDPSSSDAFSDMSYAVQQGGNGPLPDAIISYQKWLISALAWNNTPRYFCADVYALLGTVGIGDSSWAGGNTSINRKLSVIYWMIQNPACDNLGLRQDYTQGRGGQRETWFNTQDTFKVPLDTTIYSMHDLGLDSVLKYAALLGVHSGHTETILSNAIASPNPVGKGTVITFGTSREAFVKVEVFDLLGNAVATNDFEGVLEKGTHSVPISTHDLPAGTYYARIMTTYGEVQTVKLVKE